MKHLHTFESFLNEGTSFRKGDKVKHVTFDDIIGVIAEGPMDYSNLQKKGFDKDEAAEDIEDSKRSAAAKTSNNVWYGIELTDGQKVIIHGDDIKKG